MKDRMSQMKKCPVGKHEFLQAKMKTTGTTEEVIEFYCCKCLLLVTKRELEILNHGVYDEAMEVAEQP